MATITGEQAEEIRTLHENGDTYAELAKAYGVSKISIKNICKFKTHAVPGDRELRPRYVSTTIPAEMYQRIEEYADKLQIDLPTAILRMLQYTIKMNRAFGSKPTADATTGEPTP